MKRSLLYFLLCFLTASLSHASNKVLKWDLTETIKTETIHKEVRTSFRFVAEASIHDAPPSISFSQDERVLGVTNPYTSINFHNEIELSPDKAAKLWIELSDLGVDNCIEDDNASWKDPYLESVTIGKSHASMLFSSLPEDNTPRAKLHLWIQKICKQAYLDEPDSGRTITLHIGETPNRTSITILADKPVHFPVKYNNRQIRDVQRYEDRFRLFFDDSGELTLTGKLLEAGIAPGRTRGGFVLWAVPASRKIPYAGDYTQPIQTTLSEIWKTPEKFHGKRVRVSGFFFNEFEYQHFTDYSDALQPEHQGVWIGELSSFCEPGTKKLCGNVTIEGTFHYQQSGHFGGWEAEITCITKMESVKQSQQ